MEGESGRGKWKWEWQCWNRSRRLVCHRSPSLACPLRYVTFLDARRLDVSMSRCLDVLVAVLSSAQQNNATQRNAPRSLGVRSESHSLGPGAWGLGPGRWDIGESLG